MHAAAAAMGHDAGPPSERCRKSVCHNDSGSLAASPERRYRLISSDLWGVGRSDSNAALEGA
jgi:hypothetical protein